MNRKYDRKILGLALPALGALAADPLVSLVDTAFVGRIGTTELAALGVDAAIFGLAFFAFNFLAYGVTPLVAQALGRGDEAQASRVIANGLIAAAALGFLVVVVLEAAAGPILGLMGATDELGREAIGYLRIRAAAAPAVLIITLGHGAFRGYGDTKTPLYVTLGLNIINLVLDPILIFGLGWGLAGAATATLVAQWVGAVWFLALLVRRLDVRFASSSASELLGLLKVGRDILIRTASLLVTFTVATRVATAIGEVEVAAHQIAMQLLIFLALTIDALAIAAQNLIARSLGEERLSDARGLARRLLELGAIVGLIFAGLLVVSQSFVPAWFTSEVEVQEALQDVWLILALFQPLAALVYVWDGIVLGASDFKYLAGAMVVSMLVAVTVMALVVPFGWGLAGVWWSFGVLTVVRVATLGWWHARPNSTLRPLPA